MEEKGVEWRNCPWTTNSNLRRNFLRRVNEGREGGKKGGKDSERKEGIEGGKEEEERECGRDRGGR